MKKILKVLAILFGLFLAFIAIILLKDYAPDKSLAELKETWAYPNSQFIEIDGMPVHYRINGEGTPLVLIHGTGASLHTWEEWTKILEKDFQIVSLDMPAFGLTGPNNTGKYSLEFYAKFLDNFLTQVGIDSFHIAGNSLGGAISWRYAAMFPEKVQKMILLDAGGYPSKKEPPLAFQLAKNKLLSKVLTTVTPKSLFYKSMNEVYYNDDLVTEELVNRYYELYLREGNRQAFVDRVNNIEYTDPSLIKTIKNATLIIWGKTDEWVPLESAYKFEKDLENSELIIYDNAGHLPMEEIPVESAEDAKEFLLKNNELVPDNQSISQN